MAKRGILQNGVAIRRLPKYGVFLERESIEHDQKWINLDVNLNKHFNPSFSTNYISVTP